MEHREYKSINKSVRKKDSMQLLLGKPVYTDDLVNNHPLVVKILRSPHPNAIVEEINTAIAKKVPGVVDIYTWEDVPDQRFTNAGQTYPEASPYDRLILDRHVRFSGDAVAIIAAETEKAALKAMKLIKVKYQILEAVLDYHTAKDGEILVHPEEEWVQYGPWGGDHKRNLVATERDSKGDVDAVMADCDVVIDHVYHTKAFNQAMMETFRSYAEIDRYGRLHMISSTQIVFHTRRIIARALGISKSKVRVEKPRIGGGFGAKQTSTLHLLPGRQGVRPRSSIQEKNHRSQDHRDTRWRSNFVWAQIRMVRFVQLIFIHCLIPVPMENMDRRQLDCPDINQSRCIPVHWKRTVSIMMLYIRIFRRRVHTGVMGQRRESLRWNLRLMNWQKNCIWIRPYFVTRTW